MRPTPFDGIKGSPEFSEWHGGVQEKRKGKERSGERGGREPGNIGEEVKYIVLLGGWVSTKLVTRDTVGEH
jgi:hypothetical protein